MRNPADLPRGTATWPYLAMTRGSDTWQAGHIFGRPYLCPRPAPKPHRPCPRLTLRHCNNKFSKTCCCSTLLLRTAFTSCTFLLRTTTTWFPRRTWRSVGRRRFAKAGAAFAPTAMRNGTAWRVASASRSATKAHALPSTLTIHL